MSFFLCNILLPFLAGAIVGLIIHLAMHRAPRDTLVEAIKEATLGKTNFTTADVLRDICANDCGIPQQKRASAILSNLGFQHRISNNKRVWIRPELQS